MGDKPLNRREFIKSAAVGFSSFTFPFISQLSLEGLSIESLTFPESERLGRVVDERVKVKSRPDMDSEDVGELYGDDIVVWLREVVGKRPLWNTQRFIETPDGFPAHRGQAGQKRNIGGYLLRHWRSAYA